MKDNDKPIQSQFKYTIACTNYYDVGWTEQRKFNARRNS